MYIQHVAIGVSAFLLIIIFTQVKRIISLQLKNNNLTSELAVQKSKNADHLDSAKKYEKAFLHLKSESNDCKNNLSKTSMELDEKSKKLEVAEQLLSNALNDLTNLKDDSKKLNIELLNINSKYSNDTALLNFNNEELRRVNKKLSADIDVFECELKELKGKFSFLLTQTKNDSEKLAATEKSLSDTLNLYENSKEELGQLNLKFDQLTSKLEYIESRYFNISENIDEAVAIIGNLSNLKNKVSQLKLKEIKLEGEYSRGKDQYETLLAEVAVLEERLEMYSFGLYEPHFSFDASEKYKEKLMQCYEERKKLTKGDLAVTCGTTWTVNGSVVEGRKKTRHYTKIMLRAFNGECDSAILKAKWNNVKSMEERIKKSFKAINSLGETHNIILTDEYLQLRLKELWLTHEYQEKLYEEREEQRRIREQIREEERSIREMEAARLEAENEEVRYKKALEKAHAELNGKFGTERVNLINKISELESNLQKVIEIKNRAISMAQVTKAGFVYIISNIGSFGENVFKIGMTRRLEPSDRVRELSGASVPFPFDVHAMIYSQNAPELENNFHKKFKFNRLNLMNGRKEFFKVSLQEIAYCAVELNHEIQITKLAEARDFRETAALREKLSLGNQDINSQLSLINNFPDKLFDVQKLMDEDEVPSH